MNIVEREKPLRLLFNTQFYWQYAPVEYSLAFALKARGHTIKMVGCGGLPEYCELQTNEINRPNCKDCSAMLANHFDHFRLPFCFVNDFILPQDVEKAQTILSKLSVNELLKFEFKFAPVGELARFNLFQYYHGNSFEITGKIEKIFRKCVHSAILLMIAKNRIVNDFQPDLIVTSNGKFLQWAPLLYVAREKNIRFVTWEDLPLKASGVIFAKDEIAHEQRIDVIWQEERQKLLSEQQRTRIFQHFDLWKKSKITPFRFYDESVIEDRNSIRDMLSLDMNKPVISLFPNVCWDSTSVGFDGAFVSMFDWIFKVVKFAAKRPDLNFVIRAHPAEKKIPQEWKSSTPVCEEIRKRIKKLSPNVQLVESDSPISSYSLGSMSDVLMVYTSTMGIEFALMGLRPWVVTNCYYAGKGFTVDVKTPRQLFALLGHSKFEKRLTPDQIEVAERFAHITRFRRVFSYPFLLRLCQKAYFR